MALDATDKDVAIGGAGLAAIELGLVDELRKFRHPVRLPSFESAVTATVPPRHRRSSSDAFSIVERLIADRFRDVILSRS